jgi:hypothetical protein
MKQKKPKQAESVGAILNNVLDGLGLKAAISRHRIVQLWPTIVNTAVARHAVAEKVTGPTLHVVVDSSVWMNELAAVKNVLLEKVNAHLDPAAAPITDIRFHQRSWAGASRPDVSDPVPPEPSADDIRLTQLALEPVKDEELREIIKRLLEEDRRLKYRRDELD